MFFMFLWCINIFLCFRNPPPNPVNEIITTCSCCHYLHMTWHRCIWSCENTTLPSFSMEWQQSFGEMEPWNVPHSMFRCICCSCCGALTFFFCVLGPAPMLIRLSLVCVVITYKWHDMIDVFGHVKYDSPIIHSFIHFQWNDNRFIFLVKWKHGQI